MSRKISKQIIQNADENFMANSMWQIENKKYTHEN